MATDEIGILSAEVRSLKKEVEELRALLNAEALDVTHHIESMNKSIVKCHDYIAEMHDFIWPLVRKVFPIDPANQEAIESFMKRKMPPDSEASPPSQTR